MNFSKAIEEMKLGKKCYIWNFNDMGYVSEFFYYYNGDIYSSMFGLQNNVDLFHKSNWKIYNEKLGSWNQQITFTQLVALIGVNIYFYIKAMLGFGE